MLIVLIPTLFLIAFLILGRYWKEWGDSMHLVHFVGSFISAALLLFVLVAIPVERYNTYAAIQRFEAICASYQEDSLSNTSWNVLVAEQNAGLASKQFYNTTIWDWMYPDEIMDVQPLGERCHKDT